MPLRFGADPKFLISFQLVYPTVHMLRNRFIEEVTSAPYF